MGEQRHSASNIIRNYFKRNKGADINIEKLCKDYWTLNITRRHMTTIVSQLHATMPHLYRTGCGVYCYSPDVELDEYVNAFEYINQKVAEGNNLIDPEDLMEAVGMNLQSVRGTFCSLKKHGYKVIRKSMYYVEKIEEEETC